MIECAANCVPDEEISKAFEYSYKYLGQVAKVMDEIKNEFGTPKVEYTKKEVSEELINKIKDLASEKIEDYYSSMASENANKKDFENIVKEPVLALFTEEETETYSQKSILEALDKIFKAKVRENILNNNRRIDGRGMEEIREIEIRINPLPRVHGSSMFQRGDTQVLNILTLAAPGNEQLMEAIEGETKKKYIHHYNAPPYSVGEVGRFGFPGRREIGHGGLAEKALIPVLPIEQDFPYVIRLVSEVMGQNGSSSMASTCASSITLMAGGVPIKEHVAGISIGLMTGTNDDKFVTLTDIRGIEDFSGDMDFKIAGTENTITAIQMDTKIKGLTYEIVKQAINQAKDARKQLLKLILNKLPAQQSNISKYAPKIESIQIPVDFIGKVVGPGGKVIKQLSADYNVEIHIDDDGKVNISGDDNNSIESVKNIIQGIVSDPKVGAIYNGKVTRILDFGAFVEIFPGKEGLVHISKISKSHVTNIHDILSVGQSVKVKLLNIDSQNRLNLSMSDNDSNDEPHDREKKSLETKKRY